MKLNDRLKSRPGLNTAIGVVFAILAGLLLLGYFSHILKGDENGPLVTIPVASRDIELGVVLRKEMIGLRKIPSGYVVPGTIRRFAEIAGGRSLRFIRKGEPFTSSAVLKPNGTTGTLASKIPADYRAYSLQLDRSSGAGPDLRPGDRVDVLATSGEPPMTRTILRSRLILGTGSFDDNGDGGKGGGVLHITVLVSPAEVELLAQAESEGRLSISLCPLAAPK